MDFSCFLLALIFDGTSMKNAQNWLKGREVIHRNDANGGLLVRLDEGRVGKIFPMKSAPLHLARVLLRNTKAHKQFRSMQALGRAGVATPEPLEVVSFWPGSEKYEGGLIYRYLEDVVEVREALQGDLRGVILKNLARNLIAMARAGVLFIDLHLGNILTDDAGELFWIDVEVSEGASLVRERFWSRIERLHRKCDPGVLSDGEYRELCDRLAKALPGLSGEPSF